MSEELTEQWQNGKLPFGMYYVKTSYGDIRTDETVYLVGRKRYRWRYTDICCVEEIIAPVPSYSEYQSLKDNCDFTHICLKGARQKITQLEKQLDIATKALQYYAEGILGSSVAQQALKEMEEV